MVRFSYVWESTKGIDGVQFSGWPATPMPLPTPSSAKKDMIWMGIKLTFKSQRISFTNLYDWKMAPVPKLSTETVVIKYYYKMKQLKFWKFLFCGTNFLIWSSLKQYFQVAMSPRGGGGVIFFKEKRFFFYLSHPVQQFFFANFIFFSFCHFYKKKQL